MKIYDCFMFWNEIEVLYIRLDVLYDYVDYFVICESKESHSKKIIKSEFEFIKHKQFLSKFMDKIIYLPIETLPFDGDVNFDKQNNPLNSMNWPNENFQRKYIFNAIQNINGDDIIAISDVDEIYDPLLIQCIKDNIGQRFIIGINHKLFYYYVNAIKTQIWQGSIFIQRNKLRNPDDIQTLRDNRTRLPNYLNGGWHYSWMGDANKIKEKFQCIAEHDLISKYNTDENIYNSINNISDLFNRNGTLGEIKLIDVFMDNNAPVRINDYINTFPYILFTSSK